MRALARYLAFAWIGAVMLLLSIHIVAPQRSGLLALTEVFEPYIVVTALIAAPFALLGRTRAGIFVVVVLVVASLGRYVPGTVSIPAAGPHRFSAATWNVLGGSNGAARMVEGLLDLDSDLVALIELQPHAAEVLENRTELTERWPYRFLAPDPGLFGSGLLSRLPITDETISTDPTYLRAEVALSDASVVVYVIHPPRPGTRGFGRFPSGLETAVRDAELNAIRAAVESDVAAGRTVLVAGDFNATEREPAYLDFVRGLRDAHLDSGIGPGLTWRPEGLENLPFGVVRIDYLLTTPDLQATSTHVVCNDLSDHCLLAGAFR